VDLAKTKFDTRLVIHNAGGIGDVTKRSSELNDEQQWVSYLQTNFISTVYLNNLLYSAMGKEVFPTRSISIQSLTHGNNYSPSTS
jgi:hypothetical protein